MLSNLLRYGTTAKRNRTPARPLGVGTLRLDAGHIGEHESLTWHRVGV
jgi:hypothetical protein